MKNKIWLISNKNIIGEFSSRTNRKQFTYYINDLLSSKHHSELAICINGHAIPRNEIYEEYKNISQSELVYRLYQKYGTSFIKKVNGNFTIVIIDGEVFHIFSDRFGIKKLFYWYNGKDFMISNDLKTITKNVTAKPSVENMEIYALTYHFVGGKTIFENVNYNKPAEIISFNDGKLSFSKYWDAGDLLSIERKDVSIEEISEALTKSVEQSLEHKKSSSISLSLTGGADTRNLLAIFLKLGIKPHLYTYGNPKSDDCYKAAAVAKGLKLEHIVHDIKMTPELFREHARNIIIKGQSLASIHRVHRILAVQKEKEFAEIMFLGTLGGEFVKGVSEDDYIVPSLVYENWDEEYLTANLVSEKLEEKSIYKNGIDFSIIRSFLNDEPYFKDDRTKRKFYALSHITANLHDAQDLNLYETQMENVFTPFLDIDYLEVLFSSQYTFNNKEVIKNKYLRRIENPVYGSIFLKVTYPPLLKYKYSGEHIPKEVLFNKYYAAFAKAVRKKIGNSYPPNFPLNQWMFEFVQSELPKCNDYDILKKTFDIGKLEKDLSTKEYLPKESFWLRFTNPIMMKYVLDEYFN